MKKSKSQMALPRAIPHALAALAAGVLAAAATPAGATPILFPAIPVNTGDAALPGGSGVDSGIVTYGLGVDGLVTAGGFVGPEAEIDAVTAGTLTVTGGSKLSGLTEAGDIQSTGSGSFAGDLTSDGLLKSASLATGNAAVADLDVKGDLTLSDSAAGTVRDVARTAATVEGSGYVSVAKTAGSGIDPDRYTVSVSADGSVAEGDTGLVTGGTVWSAVKDFQAAASKAQTGIASGDGSIITRESVTPEGSRQYDLAVNPDLKLDSLRVGSGSDSGATGVTINAAGMDLGGGSLTGLAPGRVAPGSTDAVTGGQLYEAERKLDGRLSDLKTDLKRDIAKSGAATAALAALHPQDFAEGQKFSVAVGLGHYKGRQALALGGFLRPAENLMISLAAAVSGGSSTAVNAGLSYRFGGARLKSPDAATLKATVAAQAAELTDLRAQVAALSVQNASLAERFEAQLSAGR